MDWLEVMEIFDLVAAALLVGLLVAIWLGTAAEPVPRTEAPERAAESLQDEVALGDPEAENGSEGPSEAD